MVAYEEVIRSLGDDPQTKQEWLDYLAAAHGDIEDSKATLLFLPDDEVEEVEAEDIEAVTDEPPTATFT